ncbi:MAG: hypothetical protein Q8L35_01030 [Actinomycetota bacterium]|nr:hypothetical protein [Actinomycetota bacterium]
MMTGRWKIIRMQQGYSIIEAMVVVAVMGAVIGGIVGLTQIGLAMNRQSQDGFVAQNEGRTVLSEMVRWLRPAQNIASNDVPILHATSDGRVIDVRVDSDKDGVPELARLELDRTGKRIVLYMDKINTNNQYNYQAAGDTYLGHYGYGSVTTPTVKSAWDSSQTIAEKIVNAPTSGSNWTAQTPTTDPTKDFRLFTFYGNDFDVPLDTVANIKWTNYVRGVKLYIWSDIQPAEIPSPFGIQTDVYLRNISGE